MGGPARTGRESEVSARAVSVAVVLGLLWSLLVVRLMGGSLRESLSPEWLLAGAFAGLGAGGFTGWSRTRRDGREHALDVIATYYLAMLAYWLVFAATARLGMVIRHGGWTSFDAGDHLRLLATFATLGTFPYGLVLVPLTWASRALVWRVETAARRQVA